MYEVFLFTHSWFRWLVVIAAIRLIFIMSRGLIQKKTWSSDDTRTVNLFNEVLAYQVGMGIALYGFLSPLPKIGWSDMAFTLKDPIIRFWTIEHATSMIFAISTFQIGKFIALKKTPPEKRFKAVLIAIGISFLFILAGIPWPFLKHGRNLFRFYF